MSHYAELTGFVVLTFLLAPAAAQSQFASGDLVVVRVGTGTSALTSASTAVFLDEYTPAGNRVRTIAFPTAPAGSNQPVTLAGTSASEGGLTRSVNGRYLSMGGYAAAAGVAVVGSSSSATVSRVVARIDGAGTIDATTRFLQAFDGSSIRGAVTADGAEFWASGNSLNAGAAGIEYIALGSYGGGTQILATPNNTRCVAIYNGQVYATSGVNNYTAVFTVGSGLPTMGGQTTTLLRGFPTTGGSPYAFAFDTSLTICYLADDRATSSGGGVQKWVWRDTIWALAATFSSGQLSGVRGLTVDWSGPHPNIYATTAVSSANQIVLFTDTSSTPAPVVIATADSNTAFRGIAFAPSTPAAGIEVLAVPAGKYVLMNYPNPFNPETVITYTIPRGGVVRLAVYDVLGREVQVLSEGYQPEGEYRVKFSGAGLSSGVYYCRMQAGPFTRIISMSLIR
jgi:hypothetical protein